MTADAAERESILPSLLVDHVRRFNQGVRTADWRSMIENFSPDGMIVFDGVRMGPFRGHEAIARGYREQPPDDTITVLELLESTPERIVASYAWDTRPGARAGELRMALEGNQILRLTVRVDRAIGGNR
jgi:steroid Delta-isomerase